MEIIYQKFEQFFQHHIITHRKTKLLHNNYIKIKCIIKCIRIKCIKIRIISPLEYINK